MPYKDKEVERAYYKKRRMIHGERINKYSREYHRKHKERDRSNRLKSRMGITLDQYNKMFSDQNGKCFICGTHQSELKVSLSIDHDHSCCPRLSKTTHSKCCGKCVRGLLCGPCNQGLGSFKDSPDILKKAIEYLEVWTNRNARIT